MAVDVDILTRHDRERWQELAGQVMDPHVDLAYLELWAEEGEQPLLLSLRENEGVWLVPLIERTIDGTARDLTSGYGFGGPFAVHKPGPVTRALSQFCDWVRASGYVSLFMRLSPGEPAEPDQTLLEALVPSGRVVQVNLDRTADQLWKNYEHKVRKNVNKAVRSGCTVHFGQGDEMWQAFIDIYRFTMARRSAAQRYLFDDNYFAGIRENLAAKYILCVVKDGDGKAVSAELVLTGDETAYSFLGGTLPEAFAMAPNDLLKHQTALWLRETGRRQYMLGGGLTPDDGIFRYKRAFDPKGILDFTTLRYVADSTTYHKLSGGVDTPFFPAYRAP